ncbi:hypothetical protein KEM55_003117 [Ascosphaera atra]|nr:hypothetical protein KEM55_003117 [Ascosphaera atra]
MYSWTDVARRTERVYKGISGGISELEFYGYYPYGEWTGTRGRIHSFALIDRLKRYYGCGIWAGKLFCLCAVIDFLILIFLESWWPKKNIDIAKSWPRKDKVKLAQESDAQRAQARSASGSTRKRRPGGERQWTLKLHHINRDASQPVAIMSGIKPPFTKDSAVQKVKAAQAAWNTRNPQSIAQSYTPDCIWRNRTSFLRGTEAIISFLQAKWERERNYRLRKELFAFSDDRIAVQFWYEYQDAEDGMRWKRCYGLEDWTFDWETGKMCKRMMSGNDVVIGEDGDGAGRWFTDDVEVDDVSIGEEHW